MKTFDDFKAGDAVTCLGEGSEVFTVEEVEDHRAMLAGGDGSLHGWEELRKLTKKAQLEPGPVGPGIVALSEAEVAGFLTDSNWGED